MTDNEAAQHPGAGVPVDGQPTTHDELTRREMRTRHHRRHRALKAVVIGLVVVLAAVLGVGGYTLWHLNGNIRSLDIQGGLLGPAADATTDPTSGQAPMNILVMGVDSRAGANAAYGDAQDARSGERSDTTMLVHLAADRQSAVVVSIPRDVMMPAPPRVGEKVSATADAVMPSSADGTKPPGCVLNAPVNQWKKRQFNSNITDGGVDCVVATVVHNTGIPINHVITVDFTGFKEMVNAMGSIRICTTKPVKDKDSGLDLAAGYHDLNGEQALAFVRTRHGIGDGSDIGRMRLQQDFAAAMVRKATSTGVLLNPSKLYGLLDAATKALKPDAELANMGALGDLASQLRDMKPANVRFLTAPTEPYTKDINRLQLAPSAAQVWTILREDKPWPETVGSTATATPTPTAEATVAPSTVPVIVENASATDGLATQVAGVLKAQGFVVKGTASAAVPINGVVIHHSKAQTAAAKELQLAFPGSTLKADGKDGTPLRVSVGRGAKPVVAVPNRQGSTPLPDQPIVASPVPGTTASATPTIQAKSAGDDVCSDTSKQ